MDSLCLLNSLLKMKWASRESVASDKVDVTLKAVPIVSKYSVPRLAIVKLDKLEA